MRARIVLDTSAYSRFRNGHDAVHEALAGADAVVLPVTVLGELEAAFELGSRARANRMALAEFLEEPFVVVPPLTAETARRYGRLFAAQKRAGKPVPVNDLWIAASTMESGGHLLTFDADFARIEGLDHTLLSA